MLNHFREDLSGSILAALIVVIGIVTAGVCIGNELGGTAPLPLEARDPYPLERSTVRVGEPIVVDLEVCNNTDVVMIVDSTAAWIPVNGVGEVRFTGPTMEGLEIPIGCHPSTVEIPTTYEKDGEVRALPPGKWVRTGLTTIRFPFGLDSLAFASEPFEVVP